MAAVSDADGRRGAARSGDLVATNGLGMNSGMDFAKLKSILYGAISSLQMF